MLRRPASHRDEGIVRTDPKGSENPSPHLHHHSPWVFGLRGFFDLAVPEWFRWVS